MSNNRVIQNLIHFQQKETIPFAVLAGYTWICRKYGYSTVGLLRLPDGGAKITVDAYREMGSEMMYGGGGLAFFAISAMGGEVNNDIPGNACEILTRPLQELEDIRRFDLQETIRKMKESEEYALSARQVREMRKYAGPDATIVAGGFSAFTIASQMMGVDNFLVALMDDEDEVADEVLHFAAELILEFNRGMIAEGADAVILCEPVASGNLISRNMFEKYVLPINREMALRTREICDNVIVHVCGNTQDRVKSVTEMGASIFSVDTIDLGKAYEDAGGKMALFGNLDPTGVLVSGTPEQVYSESCRICESMQGRPGFILAPGCDLAPATPLENIQAMARAASHFPG